MTRKDIAKLIDQQANGIYAYEGATDHHLALMRKHCPASVRIKAAGGVRTLDDVLRVRELGVTRIGATATEEILAEFTNREMQSERAPTG